MPWALRALAQGALSFHVPADANGLQPSTAIAASFHVPADANGLRPSTATAAWELGPTAQAEWACGAGQRNARASECLAAVVAASGGRANGHIKHVDSPDVPPGCSYSHVSGAAIFNSGAGQVSSDQVDYQLACTQAADPPPAASMPSAQPSRDSVPSPQPSLVY